MNYQRACRSTGCYQGAGGVHRTAPRYAVRDSANATYGGAGNAHTGKAQTDLKLPMATSLAMVYSPIQVWRDIYDTDLALERGTLFAELDKPLLSVGK